MKIQGSILREKGETFAVVKVKNDLLTDKDSADNVIATLQPMLSGLPVVLMAHDLGGSASYYGREDITASMRMMPVNAIPLHDLIVRPR